MDKSQAFLTGIADFYLYKTSPPRWMNNQEAVEWRKGMYYSSIQLIDPPTRKISRIDIIGQNGPTGEHYSSIKD